MVVSATGLIGNIYLNLFYSVNFVKCLVHIGISISWRRNAALSSNKELPRYHWTCQIWCIWGILCVHFINFKFANKCCELGVWLPLLLFGFQKLSMVCCLLCVQTEVMKIEFERLQARLPMDMLSMKRCVSELCIAVYCILRSFIRTKFYFLLKNREWYHEVDFSHCIYDWSE